MKNKEKDKPAGSAPDIVFTVLRIAAAVICAFLLYTFIYTMCLPQINYGNIIGVIFCVAVILLVILYPFIRRFKPLRIAARVAGAALLSFALYCGVISAFIISEMATGEGEALAVSAAGTPQTVIVLGCQVLNGEPSPMLALRLGKAEEYLKSHPTAVCVVTGGKGSNEEMSEAECMFRYLVRDGIDESRIYREDQTFDTTENLRYSAEIIEAEDLPRDVVIVSECYHIYRGVRQAGHNGLHASGIYPDPAPVIITMPSYWIREILAITRDYLIGQ